MKVVETDEDKIEEEFIFYLQDFACKWKNILFFH